MRALIDNGIVKQEISSSSQHGVYIFRFHVFQLSGSKFVIRPLESLFCPKENNEDGAFFAKFKYNDDMHSKISTQEEVEYRDLLDYIYKNDRQMYCNLVSLCTNVFGNSSNLISIYYLHPDGALFKLVDYDSTEYKIYVYNKSGNIEYTIED